MNSRDRRIEIQKAAAHKQPKSDVALKDTPPGTFRKVHAAEVLKTVQAFFENMAPMSLGEKNDRFDFMDFRDATIAGYFRERAERRPAAAEKSLEAAALIEKRRKIVRAAHVGRKLGPLSRQAMSEAFGEIKKVMEDRRTRPALVRFAKRQVKQFIADDPKRWSRLKKHSPILVGQLIRRAA